MNVNDSEKVAGLMLADGHRRAEGPADADFVFINTCAVREKASEKLFHALGRLQKIKDRRELVIGVGGCVAQLQGRAILDRAPQVDLLVGTHNVARVPELLRSAGGGAPAAVDLDRSADTFTIPTSAVAHSSPVRAYVTVIEGCNHVCSFCVVPRTRGPEVCRDAGDIVDEVASLVERGYPEVMLLGQTVNAYRHGGLDFAALLERVSAVPGLRRLRFTTSHPEHVDQRLADAIGGLPKVCPYLHLPVQSGSDRILADMRRGYSSGEYRDKVAHAAGRDPRPGPVQRRHRRLSRRRTKPPSRRRSALVDEVGFEGLFVFMYSPRPGTTAYRSADDVPEAEKLRRLQVLNEQAAAVPGRAQRRVGLGAARRCSWTPSSSRAGSRAGPAISASSIWTGTPRTSARTIQVDITGSGPNSLSGRRARLARRRRRRQTIRLQRFPRTLYSE